MAPEDIQKGRNPIMISSQQGYTACTELLYDFGFRIPQIRIKPAPPLSVESIVRPTLGWPKDDQEGEQKMQLKGEEEMVRQDKIMEPPGEEDQVEKLLAFKAYSKPHYLSLAFAKETRIKEFPDVEDKNIEDDIRVDLQKLDPLRRALDLAEKADTFSTEFKGLSELKNNYVDIKDELEVFGHGLLTQCSDMKEISTIMEHNPNDDDDDEDDDEEKNWQKALHDGCKHFVSHPYYQQYFWKQMTGSGRVKHLHRFSQPFWNLLYVPYALLLFCFYPLVVLADSCFRKGDLLFVHPTTLARRQNQLKQSRHRKEEQTFSEADGLTGKDQEESGRENVFFEFFRSNIHIPVFRMITFHAIQFSYLGLLIISVWNPSETLENTTHHWYSYAATSFTIFFLIEDVLDFLHILFSSRRRKLYTKSFWNPFSLFTRLTLVIGGAFVFYYHLQTNKTGNVFAKQRAHLSGNHGLNIGMTLVSCAMGLEFFKLLRIFLLFEYLGPIVICVICVFKDVVRVTAIYFVIFLANAVAAWSMFKPFQTNFQTTTPLDNHTANYTLIKKDLTTRKGLLDTLLWRIFYADGADKVRIRPAGSEAEEFSWEFSHFMAIALWAVYQIVVSILMLNILIAIMNTTYSEFWKIRDKEWKYSKTYYQVN